MDSASTFIRRKRSAGTPPVGPHSQPGPFFSPPSAYPPQAAFASGTYNLRHPASEPAVRTMPRTFFPPAGPPSARGVARRAPARLSDMPSLSASARQELHAARTAGIETTHLADYYAGAPQKGYYPGQPPKTAGTRPYRLPPDSLAHGRSASGGRYPSPPSTAPQAHRPTPSQSYGHTAPGSSSFPSPPHADDAARARATLIDRERRQIFSFLSSPNCFLFSAVAGPVGLTEEDLDLLLAAGNTSTWTLLHLRALDAAGKRFNGFDTLIPAVASLAHRQAEENRRVLAWLTGPQCVLFGDNSDGSGSGVLLSMADIDRLVIESQAGLDTLHQVRQLQTNGAHFDTFQQLIHAVREMEIAKQTGHTPGATAARHRKGKSEAQMNGINGGGVTPNNAASTGGANIASSPQNNAASAVTPTVSLTGASDVDGEERRLVLEYASSPECTLFSNADAVVATAADLDALIHWSGNAALAIETLMQLDQNQVKFMAFGEILPALKQLQAGVKLGGGVTLRPLLTQAEIESNRSIAHAYLASRECLLFSEKDEPVQATGRDFDDLVFAGGGAHECVAILKQLDAGTVDIPQDPEAPPRQPGGGLKFNSFPALIHAVGLTRAANLAADRAAGAADEWTPEQREQVLQWLASPACTLFSDLAAGDVEVHLRELDTLMDLGGRHTFAWLMYLQNAVPPRRFESFAKLTDAVRALAADVKANIAPKLLATLSKPTCPLFHAAVTAKSSKAAKNAAAAAAAAKGKKKTASTHAGPGTGASVAAKVTAQSVDELLFASTACADVPVHLDMLMREGRSFASFGALVTAVREAHEDRRSLAFVSDADRAAIVDFLSKENCVLFAEAEGGVAASSGPGQSVAAQLAASHPGVPSLVDDAPAASSTAASATKQSSPPSQTPDIHVRKSDLDRLIVEGKGVNMCLFHLSALNASGRQFAAFADLLPAVREAHLSSLAEKADLLAKLTANRAALFPPTNLQHHLRQQPTQPHAHTFASAAHREQKEESSIGEITQSQADALYIEGSAGGHTLRYLDVFLDSHTSFASFGELVQSVAALHAQVLRNKYANYLLERVERGMTAQEKRNAILAYLYSHECTLFSDAEDVNVSDEDLDLLQIEAGGGAAVGAAANGAAVTASNTSLAHALLFLRYIDSSGRKFQAFAPLKASVRDCHLAAVRQKRAILDHLRNAGGESASGGTGPCRLLASAPHLQRTLDARDIERLFVEGQAGPTTMSYLLDLEDQGLQFASIDAVIHAVRLAYTQALETRAIEKNVLLSYLGSGSCGLLASGGAAGPVTDRAPLKAISDMELVTLLNVGKGGVSTLFFLQLLESSGGRVFGSVGDLIAAVKEVKDGHAAARKREVAAFLKSERCHLLRDLDRTPVNQACVDRLYVEGGAGPSTLLHLWSLNVSGHSFSSVDSLVASIKVSFESSFARGGSERMMLLVHLLGPCSGGLFPTMHGLAPVFWLKLSADDLDGLIRLCESAANAMRFMVALARARKTCDSWSALLDALHALYEEMRTGRQQLLAKLSDAEECTLFHTLTPGQTTIDVHALTLRDMDALTLRTQDARKTLFLLDAFESRRARFASFADLVAAVGVAHFNTMASIRAEKALILAHLTAPTCTLLSGVDANAAIANGEVAPPAPSAPVQVLDPELDQLFLVSGSAKGTLFYLNQLEGHHKSYASMTQLIDDVTQLHAEAVAIKAEVLAFFQHPAHKLLQPPDAHSAVTAGDVDRLYSESGAGVDLLPLLWAIESQGSRFVAMSQVIASVRSAALRTSQQAKEDRLLILAFLSRPECRLFRGPVAAKPKDIDALIAAGGGPIGSTPGSAQPAAAALDLLRELDEQARVAAAAQTNDYPSGVESFTALIDAVSGLRASALAQRLSVLSYLTSPRCFLFKDAPSEVTIDSAAVDKLFLRGGAGRHTLDHVRALGVAGGRFGSFFAFDELVEAVRAMHLAQNVTNARDAKDKEDEEETKEQSAPMTPQQPRVQNQSQATPPRSSRQSGQPPAPAAAGSPAAVLAFLQSPLRRFFRSSPSAVYIGERELDALLSVCASASRCLAHLQQLEVGGSAAFDSFAEMLAAVQAAEARTEGERRAIGNFLAAGRCRLLREEAATVDSDDAQSSPVALTDAQVDQLLTEGGAGAFTLLHLQRLNDDAPATGGAVDLPALARLVASAHAAAADTLRSQKQMVRTYLASWHSDLLWSAPSTLNSASGTTQVPRHRLSDADLNQLLVEAGGSGASLLRHLHTLDDARLTAAASATGAQRKFYHTVADLCHAVRDLNHHELHAKRDVLERLNAPECALWSEAAPAASSQARASIADVDRLFDGAHAHFDTPLLLWVLERGGRRFHSASQLVEAVREARRDFAAGANAEVLALVAHLSSPLCTVLPTNGGIVSLSDLTQLLRVGGGGSATLFELFALESAGFVARDMAHLHSVVAYASNGETMRAKVDALEYLSQEARLFADDAERIEAIFAGPTSSARQVPSRATDSLAQLPVTSPGVSRMLEEGGHGLEVVRALRALDRARRPMTDLRDTVDALLDSHVTAERHEEAIRQRQARQTSASAQPQNEANDDSASSVVPDSEPPPPSQPESRWTDADRQSLIDFLSHPDTLLFSESASQLEVSARLLDRLLEAAPCTSTAPGGVRAQEALVLLHHLNAAARKMTDLPELEAALAKEHALLHQIGAELRTRLLQPTCALWKEDSRPSELSVEDVVRVLLIDTSAASQGPTRVDELELSQRTFDSLSSLGVAVGAVQEAHLSRVNVAKDALIAHLSLASVSAHLFSQAVNMNDVDLHGILLAGRFGARNCTDAVDAARADHRKFESVTALLAAVRSHTAEHEQALLSFLHTPAGSGLLARPEHVLPFLSAHLLSCMGFIYGAVDAGAETMPRARRLAEKGVVCDTVYDLVEALRQPLDVPAAVTVTALSNASSKRASLQPDATVVADQPQAQEEPTAEAAPEDAATPDPVHVTGLVTFLQDPATLLFAESSEDLSIESQQILTLFAASDAPEAPGGWAEAEAHLRELNLVHRRFTRFDELLPAIREAQQHEPCLYTSNEQVETIRSAVAQSDDGLFNRDSIVDVPRDEAGHVFVSVRQADELLRLMPVRAEAVVSGLVVLVDHLGAFGRVARRFSSWSALHDALREVQAAPERGHLAAVDFDALTEVLSGVLADDAARPSPAQVDELATVAGGAESLLSLLGQIRDRPERVLTVRLLIDEIVRLRSPQQAPSADEVPVVAEPASPSAPAEIQIPHITDEDQQRLAEFLGQSHLFDNATASLEVSVEALDALAFECGSVPDLVDLLRGIDAAGEKFLTFPELNARVVEMVRAKVAAPVGEEPKPTERHGSRLGAEEEAAAAAAAADATAAAPTIPAPVMAEPTAATEPAVVTGLTDDERQEFVAWLQSPSCAFFADSGDLTVTVEELDLIAHTGGGLHPTMSTLTRMSDNGARFESFSQILPALQAEIANPTPAAVAVAAPSTAAIVPLTDDERNEVVAVLSESSLFSDATENLEIDPTDLDVMRTDAGSVSALLAALHDLDARGSRPRTFRELFDILKAYWPTAKQTAEPAATTAATVGDAVVPVADEAPVVIGPDDAQTLVEYLGSESCSLFSEASENLSVESDALDALLISSGGVARLLAILRGMDAVGRRFSSFNELAPAVAECIESQGHIGAEARDALVALLGECGLFSDATQGLEVTVDELDALVGAGHGLRQTIAALNEMDRAGRKFDRFNQLAPAVAQHMQQQAEQVQAAATNDALAMTALATDAPAVPTSSDA